MVKRAGLVGPLVGGTNDDVGCGTLVFTSIIVGCGVNERGVTCIVSEEGDSSRKVIAGV